MLRGNRGRIIRLALAVFLALICGAIPAAAQEFIDGNYLQDFEDTTFNPAGGVWYPNWYGVTAWGRNTTHEYAGASSAATSITTAGDYTRIIGFHADFTFYDTWLGNSIVDTISFWYRMSDTHADSRVMRVIAGSPMDFWASADDPIGAPFEDSDWIPLTAWISIGFDDQWTQRVISSSETDLSIFNQNNDVWIAIQTKRVSGTSSRTLHLDNFEIKLRPRPIIVPNQPTPLSPPDGHDFQTPRPFFSWIHNDTDGAPQFRYHLQIADSITFTNIIIDDSSEFERPDTTVELGLSLPFPSDSTLFWRVRTSNAVDSYSAWSAGDSWFRVRLIPPDTPIIIGPAVDHETTVRTVRWRWTHNDPDGAPQNYAEIQLSRDPAMADTPWILFVADSSTFADTSFPPAEDTIYWRLRTADLLDSSPWTESRVLYLVYSDTPVFTAIAVANDTPTRFDAPALFDTGVNGDTVWFGRGAMVCTAIVQVASRRFDSIAVSAVFASPERVMPAPSPVAIPFVIGAGHADAGETVAILVAWDRAGVTETTRIRFRPDTVAPETVILTAPESGVFVGATPTCTWTAALDPGGAGFSYYLLQIAADPGFAAIIREETTIATALTIDAPLGDSVYFWRVLAVDRVGNFETATAMSRAFTIDSTAPTPAAPVAPSDAHETSRVPIRFEWLASIDALAGVVWQRLEIARDSAFVAGETSLLLGGLDTTALAGETLAGSGTFWWRVASRDSAGNETVSLSRSFILDTTPPLAAAILGPAAGHETTATAVRLVWAAASDSHTGIAAYRVQLDTGPGFAPARIDASTALLTETTVLLTANDTWYWRVIVIDRVGNVETGATRFLLIDTAPPSRPALLAPISGETRLAPVGFRWSAAADSMTGLASYRLQAARDSSFLPLTLHQTLDSTVTADTRWLDTGLWFWRVLALDRLGNTETSLVETAIVVTPPDTTPPAAFSLLAPAPAAETSATAILFRWQPAADSSLVTYTLTIIRAGGGLAAETTVIETSVLVTLPANDSYRWSVTAIDSHLNRQLSTETFTLVIDTAPPSPPILLSPANAAETIAPVLFRWQASLDSHVGIASYRLQISSSAAFDTVFAADSVLVATETSVALGSDTWHWRVRASDRLGNASLSATRSIRVVPASESAPPIILAAAAAPLAVGNAGAETTRLAITAFDTSRIDTVVAHLLILGAHHAATRMETITVSDTEWRLEVRIDTRVLGETYLIRVTVTDRFGNTAETWVRLVVLDVSPPFAAVTNLIVPPGETVLSVSGNAMTIAVETGSIPGVTSVLFEYRPRGGTLWLRADSLPRAGTPNPATVGPPWVFVWALPETAGLYDLRAVGVTAGGASDPSPSFFPVAVAETPSLLREHWSADSRSAIFLLVRDTAQSFHLGRLPLMTTETSTINVAALRVRATRYETAPADAPAPQGRVVAGEPRPVPGAGFFRFEVLAPGSLVRPCTISITLGGIAAESRALLAWHRYDRELERWIRQPSALTWNQANETVVLAARADSFSVWAPLFGPPIASDLAGVIVYPNPFIPYDNNPRTGVPFISGLDGTGVIFDRLTEVVTIEIYTISGVRVATIRSRNSGGRIHWNAQNEDRRDLASGVYLCVIKSGAGERVVRKLMVIR